LVKGLLKRTEEPQENGSSHSPGPFPWEEVEGRELVERLSRELRLPIVPKSEFPKEPLLLEGTSGAFLSRHAILPLSRSDQQVTVLMANPLDLSLIDTLKRLWAVERIEVKLAYPDEIREAVERLYESTAEQIQDAIKEADEETEVEEEQLRYLAMEAPIVRLVNTMIVRAVEMRASDIHFEPFERGFRVRYRIDGILHDVESPPKRLQPAIITRLKLMANLNIAEHRLPQDGRIKLRFGGKEVDIRVSTTPTVFGESVVLRLLYQEEQEFELENLGLGPRDYKVIAEKIRYPNGIILVTGPTGSGKTTTLYAILKRINSPDKKIITVEDPVEYQIDGINQIQVRPEIDLTFANILRSIVRQDPDVILIGEIRDLETAEIAIQSALTGHLVFSTLHTNDAPTAITRLEDLQVEPFLISASVVMVMAQRLVRVLCPDCKVPASPSRAVERKIAEILSTYGDPVPEEMRLYRPVGCPNCAGTGYRGRTGIFEVMEVDEAIRSLIVEGAEADLIRKEAVKAGMRPMVVDGVRKALQGLTTLEEVLRVTKA